MNQPRRSFLDDLPPAPQEHVHHIPAASTSLSDTPKRPGRKPAHRRNRTWEQQHPPVTFVGVPLEIREDIRNLSAHYREQYGMVGGVDAVARELLGYALKEYAEGKVDMRPTRSQPRSQLRGDSRLALPRQAIPAHKSGPKKEKQPRASYRLPADQVEKIGTIIQLETYKAAPRVVELTRGQVVTRLFTHALDAYRDGRFSLYTTIENVNAGLRGEAVQ
jgi:hypothetical protein